MATPTVDYSNGTAFDTLFPWEDFFLNDTNNETSNNDLEQDDQIWREIPLGVLLVFLSLLTFVGNAMVLHAVKTERRLQTVSIHYLQSHYVFVLRKWIVIDQG